MRLAAALLASSAFVAPAWAEPTAYDAAFVSAFEAACVPGRLSYRASQEAVRAAGWMEAAGTAHPELAALLERSAEEARDPELNATYDLRVYSKNIEGQPHFLVLSTVSAVVSDPADPWVQTGCYLYNLDATAPLAPEPVTALVGKPVNASREEDGIVSHIWGPPCPMPMTGDTYLSFVPEGSAAAAEMGVPMSGIVLNFSTTELAEGEPVPAPYC